MSGLVDVEISDELRGWLREFPLPEGIEDDDLNQEQIAQIFSTSTVTISKWLKAGMPVVQEGGPGKSYILRASHCWAWRKGRDAQAGAQTAKQDAMIARLQAEFTGMDIDEDEAKLTTKQRRELVELQLRLALVGRERGTLVPLDDLTSLFGDVLTIVREGSVGLTDRLERELSLKPAQTRVVTVAITDMLNRLIARMEEEHGLADVDADAALKSLVVEY